MDLPERPRSEPPRSGWLSLVLAACAGLMILTALVLLTGGFLGLVIMIGGGVFAFAAFHYLVWGWWLSKSLYKQEEEAENARQQQVDRDHHGRPE